MIRKCYICKVDVELDLERSVSEFNDRFENEDILDAVVICDDCNKYKSDVL